MNIERLRLLFLLAPHHHACATFKHGDGLSCDCWKREAEALLLQDNLARIGASDEIVNGAREMVRWMEADRFTHREQCGPKCRHSGYDNRIDQAKRHLELVIDASLAAGTDQLKRKRTVEGRCVACLQPIYGDQPHDCPTPRFPRSTKL